MVGPRSLGNMDVVITELQPRSKGRAMMAVEKAQASQATDGNFTGRSHIAP
jgi:hypothetical protein